MLRLSKLTDYAVVVLVRLGQVSSVSTSSGVASATHVPEPTVAKVLKALAGGGLVISQRGARGGYRLARPLAQMNLADVIGVIDGPIALTACVDGGSGCEVDHVCAVRGRWDLVNDAIAHAFRAISMADLAEASVPTAFRLPASKPLASAASPSSSTPAFVE